MEKRQHILRRLRLWFTEYQRDLYPEPYGTDNWSPILWFVGWCFVVLRRLSLGDLLGHSCYDRKAIPARFVDCYMLVWICGLTLLGEVLWGLDVGGGRFAYIVVSFLCFCAFQIVQVNVHRNIWRPIVDQHEKNQDVEPRQPRHHGRNLICALLGYVELNAIFAIAYWLMRDLFSPGKLSFPQAIYFSFVCGGTVGFGDIAPNHNVARSALLSVIVFQILCNLLMISLVVGTTIATIKPEPHQTRSRKSKIEEADNDSLSQNK